jgi:hypothetical protein
MSEDLNIVGKTIVSACSSLTTFSCEFADGHGLMLQAMEGNAPWLAGSVISAQDLPKESDAVCKVDWSWIAGSRVAAADIDKSAASLKLDKAGPLKISVQVWQGKPFLAFQPYRAV